MTTRLRPRVLEQHFALLAGCREVELRQLPPERTPPPFPGAGHPRQPRQAWSRPSGLMAAPPAEPAPAGRAGAE
ncbi:MAG: hypothetical protein R2911_35165 [Caldilineaceae bacterium]